MLCPNCQHQNDSGAGVCAKCGSTLQRDDRTVTAFAPVRHTSGLESHGTGALTVGSIVANRYEILTLLGEGGMGAVYKATDLELDRTVALKVIRPELAGNTEALQRFKQELILARKITHRNVIRIFDLGVTGDLKFITMEFVQGRDLHSVLKERKFSPEEAVKIIMQVCEALQVAHSEQVVHRDLKPHNILLDDAGRVCVMDFGLARSLEMPGLTQTGAFMGTPAYMSPEQATGKPADARSDIFALGIILYELLTGTVPFQADTVLGSLLMRTQGPPSPPIKLDASIPKQLSDITLRCLTPDPARRYQNVHEMMADLDRFQGGGKPTTVFLHRGIVTPRLPMLAESTAWKWISIAVAAVLVILAGIYAAERLMKPVARPSSLAVLVADFNNSTSDPVFNGTLEPAFTVALEGASFITAYSRSDARRIAAQLQPGATKLDEPLARLVAVRQGISVVVAGSILKEAAGYEIALRATDAFTGKTIATESVKGTGKDGVLSATVKLAARLRKVLGDDTPEALQMAAAETFSAASLEAAHAFAEGEQFERAGKRPEAITAYLKAVDLDPNLGRAYASLAAVYSDLGQIQDAEKYHTLALSRIDRMSDREKYKTRGIYYLANGNHQKAVEELSALVQQYPSDAGGLKNLALAYFYARDLPHALEIGRRATQIYPKNIVGLNNVALYAMYAGDFQTAAAEAREVIQMSPTFVRAYLALALSELAQGRTEQAAEVYHRMESAGVQGASLSVTGLADLAMYQGRLADAQPIIEKGFDADSKSPASAANKLTMLADLQLMHGRSAAAIAYADRAVVLNREENILFPAARIYLNTNQGAKAESLAAELAGKLGSEPQLYAKLIRGEALLQRGKARDAVQMFQDAQKTADAWLAHFDLGRAYLEVKAFPEAYAEFETCVKRRGEALAVFLDDVPSSRYLPPVNYYLGVVQEALKSPAAAQSFQTFLSIKEKGSGDPLIEKARRRLDAGK